MLSYCITKNRRKMKSRTTAWILALFLGGIGIHKFYLRKTAWGVVYLVFCWTYIPLIVSFVEFIVLASMSDKEFNLKYNTSVPDPMVTTQSPAPVNPQYMDDVKKLYEMKEKGMITEEEYELKKKMLM